MKGACTLTKAECQELINTVDILIFATIAPQAVRAVCANNDSWGPPSADVFELVTQSFRVGSREIAVQAGSCLSTGDEIGEITFPKPWATGGMFGSPDEELVKGLGKCFSPQFPKDVTERIFRSLEWFRLAHIEGGQVSVLSKLVMMATAFEVLLQFPTKEKRKYFVEYTKSHIASDEFLRDNRSTKEDKVLNFDLAGCWVWDFYNLRSRIVHGDSVSPDDLIYRDWITHLIVADLVYCECLKRKLFIHNCIGNSVYSCAKEFDKVLSDQPQGTSVELLTRSLLGFNSVHRALGWIDKKKQKNSRSGLSMVLSYPQGNKLLSPVVCFFTAFNVVV